MNRKEISAVAISASTLILALTLPSAPTQPELSPPKTRPSIPSQELPTDEIAARVPLASNAESHETVTASPEPARVAPSIQKSPEGKYVIEGRTVQLRYADGRIEERPLRIVATPVQKPLRRATRNKETATTAKSPQNQ